MNTSAQLGITVGGYNSRHDGSEAGYRGSLGAGIGLTDA